VMLDRPPPCCARLPDGGWCVLEDGHRAHGVACVGIPARPGPHLPIDRKLMRRELWDPTWDPRTRRAKETP